MKGKAREREGTRRKSGRGEKKERERDYLLSFPMPVPSTHHPAFGALGCLICSRAVRSQVWLGLKPVCRLSVTRSNPERYRH